MGRTKKMAKQERSDIQRDARKLIQTRKLAAAERKKKGAAKKRADAKKADAEAGVKKAAALEKAQAAIDEPNINTPTS